MLDSTMRKSMSEWSQRKDVLPAESEFYQSYDWCLNPYLSVAEAIGHLEEEIHKLSMADGWQADEVTTNVYLLSCGVLNCVDEYLRGPALRFPKRLGATIPGRAASRLVETISVKPWIRRRVARWRARWLSGLDDFIAFAIVSHQLDAERLAKITGKLKAVLETPLPTDLQAERLGTPIPFRRLDLTQRDCLSLGESFVKRFPDRSQSLLLLGLRTAGSYIAPLLSAYFKLTGYSSVAFLTIEPNKGINRHESKELERFAAGNYCALVVDDAPQTSGTLLAAFNIAHQAGFAPNKVKFVVPTHPAKPDWFKTLPQDSVVTLPPEQWHKSQLLDSKLVELRLTEYFRNQNFARVSVVESPCADEFNVCMKCTWSDERGIRLKRVFEVKLETAEGLQQTKYVLAKSVGWGWLGYHAFLIGHRLHGYVPPLLGLRDGILYMEWVLQSAIGANADRNGLLEASAAYVAARVRKLSLPASAVGMDLKKHNNGSRVLEKSLSRGYGLFLSDTLMRSRIGELVRKRPCPHPTLIDANMHHDEWILGPQGPLKTDYEHHGMGRSELNVIDPAYDVADTILDFELSPDEERKLISQYILDSGDTTVEQRLFLYKLLAALWMMSRMQQQLFDAPRDGDAQNEYHRRFMKAWNFLIVQTARYCGSLCHPRTNLRWLAPLVILDIDDVLDRRLFGFPCTTAAGIKALSLLSAHQVSVALNSARSAIEVKDYCQAYSLSGGVAEYGSYLWDAVHRRERVLISDAAQRQLDELRAHLQRVPGVFLDERHKYSIRAFTYRDQPRGLLSSMLGSTRASSIGDGAVAPISTHIVNQLLLDLRLDRLSFRHTTIDTTIVAHEVDKGTGLVALRDWVLTPDAETIAVGDSESDLAMFRVATRSFAPSNLTCKAEARLLGCRVSSYPYQRGLLDSVRKIVHSEQTRCDHCNEGDRTPLRDHDNLFLSALHAADQKWTTHLRKGMLDRAAYKIFIK